MKIAVLSNVNLDLLLQTLKKTHEVFASGGYGQWIPYALTENIELKAFQPKIIYVILDGTALCESVVKPEDGVAEIKQALKYIQKMAIHYPDNIIAVSTIDIITSRISDNVHVGLERTWEYMWNEGLKKLTAQHNNLSIFDLKGIIEREGRTKVYSTKMWYMGSIPYTMKSMQTFSHEIDQFSKQMDTIRKKVLVVDLDNTLWGGVVGEDGSDGIILSESLLGAAYRDTQKRIKELKEIGVLLAAVSKNNPDDVDEAFNNPHMVLKKEDFVHICANWDPKYKNIQQLASRLNLGLDSFVFLDDNEIERQQIRINLPEVAVVDFPADIAALPNTIQSIYERYFWIWRNTKEDTQRTEHYRQEVSRKEEEARANSFEEYLQSLNIKIELGPVTGDQVSRAVQLLNKTNQFNTNTIRMDTQEFNQYLQQPNHEVLVANVSDRYGDSGLVVLIMLHRERNVAWIDNFLMSCRIMGRQIEDAVIKTVSDKLAGDGIAFLNASFIPTSKNKPVSDLWSRLGFDLLVDTGEEKRYQCRLPKENHTLLEVSWKG